MKTIKDNICSFFNRNLSSQLITECPLCLQSTQSSLHFICNDCINRLPYLSNVCDICALPIAASQSVCGQCLKSSPRFDKAVIAFHYESPISEFIQSIKFNANFTSVKLLTDSLVTQIQDRYRSSSLPQTIIPVPLHPKRTRQRGFNQALEIAKQLNKSLPISISKQLVSRVINTAPQLNLSAKERHKNLKLAFKINRPPPNHCAILDDVMTTGSTAQVIANELKKAGAKQVDIWCVARAY